MSARYEIRIDPAYTFEVDIFGKIDVPETVYIDGPMGGYSSPNQNVIGAIRQQSADLDKLRAELAAAVAERDRFAIQRDQARLTIREIAQILIDQIGSVGPENAINAALRACEVIESMATRLAAIDNAPTYSLTFCHPYSRENPGQLIARPAED